MVNLKLAVPSVRDAVTGEDLPLHRLRNVSGVFPPLYRAHIPDIYGNGPGRNREVRKLFILPESGNDG